MESLENIKEKYIETPTGYLMVLTHEDDAIEALCALAVEEDIPSASFFGIGFAGSATFGFYDFERKDFDPKTFDGMELASLNGSIAWKEGQPSIHAHGTATGGDFKGEGGHLLKLVVGTGSMEITVLRHTKRLERTIEPSISANILRL